MPAEVDALGGRGVLVTRPAQQAQRLARVLEGRGARVLRFPLITIAPPSNPNAAQSLLATLASNDVVIFTSANAARFAATLLPDVASRIGRCRVACVGDATAVALERIGIAVDEVPADGSTSEDLLALDSFDDAAIGGQHVAIIKGEGGRTLLATELRERGAQVVPVDVYRRQPPAGNLAEFLEQHAADIDLGIITSGEALERFVKMAGEQRGADLPLVLPSDRVLAQAVEHGLRGPFTVPRRVNDRELADAAARLASML